MKKKGYSVEYIQEFAKELSYGKDFTKLSDQLLILGEQHHRMFRLKNEVELLIHDSPFIMGQVYIQDDPHLPKKEYRKLVSKMFKSYDNLNFFLERDTNIEFENYGRHHNLEESLQKDKEIKQLLKDEDIKYIPVKISANILDDIYFEVRKYYGKVKKKGLKC